MECGNIRVSPRSVREHSKRCITLCVTMSRPKDTPFEDGTFKLAMEFTEEYPNKPPTVRFISKMFHPNGNNFVCTQERLLIIAHPGQFTQMEVYV